MMRRVKIALMIVVAVLLATIDVCGQTYSITPTTHQRVIIKKGVAEKSVENRANVDLSRMDADSLRRFVSILDSLRADGRVYDLSILDTMTVTAFDTIRIKADTVKVAQPGDSLGYRLVPQKHPKLASRAVKYLMSEDRFLDQYIAGADTLLPKLIPVDSSRLGMNERQLRRLEHRQRPRYNELFRDSLTIAATTAISLVAPGFSQIYNHQAWKIGVIYPTLGVGLGLGIWQNTKYTTYKRQFDDYIAKNGTGRDETLNAIQTKMIQHNTYQQLAFGFAAVSYLYSLVDGVSNYPSNINSVKKATTLSMVCPGAGQVYNHSYWKLPIVVGGFASLIFCVDFNNRGYQRYSRAYKYRTDGDDSTVDEFANYSNVTTDMLKKYKNDYRRNRDLCIILTAVFYAVQVVDAHVDAHMKTYDISDDLSFNVEPSINQFATRRSGTTNTFGLNFNLTF